MKPGITANFIFWGFCLQKETSTHQHQYLRNLFLNLFLSILMNTNCSQNINLLSEQMIHVQINYCLLLMTYTSFDADPTLEV